MLFRFHIFITHLETVWKKGKKTKPQTQQKHIFKVRSKFFLFFSWMGGTILRPCTPQNHCLFLCMILVIGLMSGERSQADRCIRGFVRPDPQLVQSVTWHWLHMSPHGRTRAALTSWLASSFYFVNLSCCQEVVYRATGDCSLVSQTLRKQKEKGRKPTSNCPKQPEQKQSSPLLQHLEELIGTANPNYCDNTATQIVL